MVKVSSSGVITTTGQSLLSATDAATARTTLGLGTAATQASTAFETSGAVSSAISAHNITSGVHGITAFGATLLDDTTATAVRTTLGLGSLATQSSILVSRTTYSNYDPSPSSFTSDTTPTNVTYRIPVSVTGNGNLIRVGVTHKGDGFAVYRASIVKQSSGYVGTTTPTMLTYAGGFPGFSTTGEASIQYSDLIPYTLSSGTYLISFEFNGTSHYESGKTSGTMWKWDNRFCSDVADPGLTGYYALGHNMQVFIEVLTGA